MLRSDIRAALEADRAGRTDQPTLTMAAAPLRLVRSTSRSDTDQSGAPDPSTGRALLELALMVGVVLLVAVITVMMVVLGLDS